MKKLLCILALFFVAVGAYGQAATLNLTARKADRFQLTITATVSGGGNYDFSAADAVTFTIHPQVGGSALVTLACGAATVTCGDGTYSVLLDSTIPTYWGLIASTYRWQLAVEGTGASGPDTWFGGSFVILGQGAAGASATSSATATIDTDGSTYTTTITAAAVASQLADGDYGDVTSASAVITIDDDVVDAAALKDTDSPADEECLTYEATGTTFEWQSCGSGSGDNLTINGNAVSDAAINDTTAVKWKINRTAEPDEVTAYIDVTPSSGNATLITTEDALQVKYSTDYFDEAASGLYIKAIYVQKLGDTMTGALSIDNQQQIRMLEADVNGSNYIEFKPAAAITTNQTCTFEDDASFIPDSCVGDGTDDTFTPTDIDTDYGAETVTSDWNFIVNGTGANGAYDLKVGDTTTPDYGALQLGQVGIYASSFSASNLDLDKAMLFRQEANLGVGNDPGIEFAWMEGGNTVRMAIPEAGADNATAMIRSVTVAGPYSAAVGNNIVSCDQWTSYDANLACDTGTYGADLYVQNNLETGDSLFVGSVIQLDPDDANQLTISATSQTADHTFDFPDDEIADGDLIIGDGAGSFSYASVSAVLAENGTDELTGESLGTACAENQILKANATGGLDCAADATGGSPTFDQIGGGTNTTGAMVLGSGSSFVLEDANGAAPTTDGQIKFDRTTENLEVGDGVGTNEYVAAGNVSGDATMTTGGVVTVADDSHAHVIGNIDAFTVADLQGQVSDVTTFYTEDTTVPVEDGGTGAASLTDGGILLGSGTGAITALGVATNGQIPIGDGTTDPVLATITGTANEITVTNGAGSITIDIPTNPTLAGANFSGIVTGGITDGTLLPADMDSTHWSAQYWLPADTSTTLTAGVRLIARNPAALRVTGVRAGCLTAPTGGVMTFTVKDDGTSILSTNLTIDATEKTSQTAATPAVINTATDDVADDSELEIRVSSVSTGGAGCWVTLIGYAVAW